ncbi:hypothetical protein CN918_28605 [Priestia megaterium]|nr:hypothetical protein CN918_28605 [Priestia megaterium]
MTNTFEHAQEKKYPLADLQDLNDVQYLTRYEVKDWLIDFWENDNHFPEDENIDEVRFEILCADYKELNERLMGIDYYMFENVEEYEDAKNSK